MVLRTPETEDCSKSKGIADPDYPATLKFPEPSNQKWLEKQKEDQEMYQLIRHKIEHITENRRLTHEEIVDRLTEMVLKQIRYMQRG